MKTILVGDIHLKARLMLPIVEENIRSRGVSRVVLLGDYLDDWNCNDHPQLYLDELNFLIDWKRRLESNGIEVIALLGNHDAPYLTGELRGYSLRQTFDMLPDEQGISEVVSQKLIELGVQITYQLDDFVISHAGYVSKLKLKKWHQRKITLSDKDLRWVSELDNAIGSRGGMSNTPSPIWADFQELVRSPSVLITNQVVGHTPKEHITIETEPDTQYKLIDIDTFTTHSKAEFPYYEFAGAGELLIVEDGELDVIQTDWKNENRLEELYQQRGV